MTAQAAGLWNTRAFLDSLIYTFPLFFLVLCALTLLDIRQLLHKWDAEDQQALMVSEDGDDDGGGAAAGDRADQASAAE